jgi:hypothetical protein
MKGDCGLVCGRAVQFPDSSKNTSPPTSGCKNERSKKPSDECAELSEIRTDTGQLKPEDGNKILNRNAGSLRATQRYNASYWLPSDKAIQNKWLYNCPILPKSRFGRHQHHWPYCREVPICLGTLYKG